MEVLRDWQDTSTMRCWMEGSAPTPTSGRARRISRRYLVESPALKVVESIIEANNRWCWWYGSYAMCSFAGLCSPAEQAASAVRQEIPRPKSAFVGMKRSSWGDILRVEG